MVVEVITSNGPMAFLPCPKRSPRVPHLPRVPRSPRCVRRPSTTLLPPRLRSCLIPEIIDDTIKAHQAKFWKVCASMDAEELYDRLTIVYPVMHCTDFPGVSKFPVDEWVKQGKPAERLGAHTDRSRVLKTRHPLPSDLK